MMDNTLTLTIGTTDITMTRVNQDNYGSTYFGENGSDKIDLSISHTIPSRGQSGESHLVRLNVQHFDSEGVYQRTSSAWTVIKTFDGVQDSAAAAAGATALIGLMAPTFLGKVVARES